MSSGTFRIPQHYLTAFGFFVLNLVVVLVVIEFLSWAAWITYQRLGLDPYKNQAGSPAYGEAAWVPAFWKEETGRLRGHREYVPFTIWGPTESHGKYVNTDVSQMGMWRRTANPSTQACEHKTNISVWIFGGSTVYGTFEPDWATLPSYLSRELNADSPSCSIVQNFGVEGFVTNQELILLLEQLKTGRRPDVVILYDGFNEAGAAMEALGPPSPHHSFASIKNRMQGTTSASREFLRNTYTARLIGLITSRPSQPVWQAMIEESQQKATSVLDNYEANLRVANLLSKAYNFRLYCFWQPALPYGDKPLVPFERQLSIRDAAWYPLMATIYQEAERRAKTSGSYIFLGRIFDTVNLPIYIDEAHLGPLGNDLLAKAIAKRIVRHDLGPDFLHRADPKDANFISEPGNP